MTDTLRALVDITLSDGRVRSMRCSSVIAVTDHKQDGFCWVESAPGGDENTYQVRGSRIEVLQALHESARIPVTQATMDALNDVADGLGPDSQYRRMHPDDTRRIVADLLTRIYAPGAPLMHGGADAE